MKIDFKVPLIELDEPCLLQDGSTIFCNKMFATILGRNPHTDTGLDYMDALKWASEINEGKEIDLDTKEQKLFRQFIEKTPFLTSFAKVCLIQAIDKKQDNG